MQLSNIDLDGFLRDNWQRKPLLVRQAISDWQNPLSPDELAGLSLEPEIESRLIEHRGDEYHAEDGPLAEERFGQLGGSPYTLLVQAVDHHVSGVAALVDAFRFIPNWRIDDVMVSYANEGGGVGAHYDQYDVFLLQGAGRRRWRIGQSCDETSALIPHQDLRLLAEFECSAEYELEPGDMLYVPPGIAHEGTALDDDCMTYSIGFRAPSRADMVDGFSEHVLDALADDDRYSDAGLMAQGNPGEITADALARLHRLMLDRLKDRDEFSRWFGAYNSAPKYPDMDWTPDAPISEAAITEGAIITRNPASRFAFIAKEDGDLLLFIDGETYECSEPRAHFAQELCARTGMQVSADMASDAQVRQLILQLQHRGAIALD